VSDVEEALIEAQQAVEKAQREAPLDVSGFLLDADRAVNVALEAYRENRTDDDE
jgi:hypothetical protein